MFRVTKYRVYPNKEQEIMLARHFGCARWIYNWGLALKKEAWETKGENISRGVLSSLLPSLKKEPDTAWLSEVNSQSLQSALANLDIAFTRFFREKKGYPKFKSKHGKQSFHVHQNSNVGVNYIKIPKVGKLRSVISRPAVGNVKTITISRTPTGKYFASVLTETEEQVSAKLTITETGTIGIDLGIKHFVTLSTGDKVENPKHLKKSSKKLVRASRKHSKKLKGSKNREKSRHCLALVHEKVANQRKDFLHKLSTRLVNDNQVDSLAIEDLSVSNMMKNRCLSKAISDAGWGTFRTMLEYKAERAGKNILVIGRFEPSSKTCSCGQVNKELKLKDRVWTCSCGLTHDRDINAAKNIKRFALHPQNFIGRDTPELTLVETGQ